MVVLSVVAQPVHKSPMSKPSGFSTAACRTRSAARKQCRELQLTGKVVQASVSYTLKERSILMKVRDWIVAVQQLLLGVFGSVVMGGLVPIATAQLSITQLPDQDFILTLAITENGKSSTATVYLKPDARRVVSSTGSDNILRFDQGKIITLNNKKKQYSETTFKELAELLPPGQTTLGNLDDPEALAIMKEMMGGSLAPLVLTKQGPGGMIAGYATEKYLATGPGKMELWAAPDLKVLSIHERDLQALLPANPMVDFRWVFDACKEVNGFILKANVQTYYKGAILTTSTQEVTSLRKESISPGMFEIPSGYKLVRR